MKKLILICLLALLLLVFPVSAADNWQQFMNNSQHTGASTSKAPNSNDVLWKSEEFYKDFTIVSSSSVAVAEGKVFANAINGSLDQYGNPTKGVGELVAFDAKIGKKIWNTKIDIPEWGSWSSPAYSNGYVYTSTGQNTTCINSQTGKIKWIFTNPSGRASCNGGPVIGNGKVICADWDGQNYYCLDANTGTLLWQYTVAGNSQSTAAIYKDKIVFNSWSALYCLDMNGKLLWKKVLPGKNLCGSSSVSDDIIYLTSYDFYSDSNPALFAYDLNTGNKIWEAVIQRTDATPVIANGKLYVSGGCSGYSDPKTYCFDAKTGTLIWSKPGLGDWTVSTSYADGKIFTGTGGGSYMGTKGISALNSTTGEEVWHSDYAGGSAAITDGIVYSTGSENGKTYVYAFGSAASSESDWNPWNDTNSEQGNRITFTEVATAYKYYKNRTPVPATGKLLSFEQWALLYKHYKNHTPM